MSYPPHGPPPPFGGPPPIWPPHHHPHHPPPPPHHPPPPPHHPHYSHTYPQHLEHPTPYPYFVPGTMMVPVPVTQAETASQPTYITNYIYHGDTSSQATAPAIEDTPSEVQIAETAGDFDWVHSTATTANLLSGRAVLGGHEGWDGSPLWVIRAWHNGDLIPGKLSVRHNAASVMYNGKEIPVQNIEVLCSKPNHLRWVPASNGNVPPGAIPGGKTATGEPLYIGRARHQLSITPGKIHPSHGACYIGFGGAEVAHRTYDVLCRIS